MSSERREDPITFVEIRGAEGRGPIFRHGSWPILLSLTRQGIANHYGNSLLRLGWAVINPLALVGVYALFFKGFLQVDSGEIPYIAFVVTGIVPWRFVSVCIGSTTSLSDASHMMSKVYFPKELVPLSVVGVALVDLVTGTAVMFVVVAITGIPLTYHLIAVPVAYLLLVVFTSVVTILVSTLSVFARDLRHAITYFLIGLFFATPIMYTEEQIPSWLQWLPEVNPLAVSINAVRDLVLYGKWFSVPQFALHLGVSCLLYLVVVTYVRSVESRMVDLA
jgi:ABC-type polysaccharide/polyol phosphate export permease